MLEQDEYLARQFDGLLLNLPPATLKEAVAEYELVTDYLYNLKTTNAMSAELDSLGLLIGYARPLIPEGMNYDMPVFLFGSLPIVEGDYNNGFADLGSVGGFFASVRGGEHSIWLNASLYRKVLASIAKLKHTGITIAIVDEIASLFSSDYVIEWDGNTHDIKVTSNSPIGFVSIWLITQIFAKFSTEPHVYIQAKGADE